MQTCKFDLTQYLQEDLIANCVKFILKSKNLWAAVSPDAEGVKTRSSSSDTSDKSNGALGLIGLLVEDHLPREVDGFKQVPWS